MRVSTTQTYQRSMTLMSKLSAQADASQTQIATGKRLVSPSDDPGAYRQLAGLKRADAGDQAYAANVAVAQSVTEQSSDTLTQIENQLQRAQELLANAGTGTVSTSDRAAIGKEIESIRDTLLTLANTRDSRGQPLFGGATGDLPYEKAADGTIRYVSSGQPAAIPIGDQVSMQGSVTGDVAFAVGGSDMFAVLADFAAALQSGGDIGAAAKTAGGKTTEALQSVSLARTSVGARATRLELVGTQLTDAAYAREDARSTIEDADLATTITEFQKTLTILQATQASFSKLTSMSLFDYLR
jgi:flagellar hook-associated protein 3 FlgL